MKWSEYYNRCSRLSLYFFLTLLLGLSFSPALVAKVPFKAGEKLYFKASWGMFSLGYARLQIDNSKKYKSALKLIMHVRSADYLENIFKVRIRTFSHWNPKTRSPLEVNKKISQGFSKRYYKSKYYFKNKSASYWQKKFIGNTKKFGEKKTNARWKTRKGLFKNLPLNAQDMLSALYYLRAYGGKVQVGKTFLISIFDDTRLKNYRLKVLKKETIKTSLGTFQALKVESNFKIRGVLKSSGKVYAWVSDDINKYPLKMSVKIPILGDVKAELVKIENSN